MAFVGHAKFRLTLNGDLPEAQFNLKALLVDLFSHSMPRRILDLESGPHQIITFLFQHKPYPFSKEYQDSKAERPGRADSISEDECQLVFLCAQRVSDPPITSQSNIENYLLTVYNQIHP